MRTFALLPAATLAACLVYLVSVDSEASPPPQFQARGFVQGAAPTTDGIGVVGTGKATIEFDTAVVELKVEVQKKSMLQTMTDFRDKGTLLDKALQEFVDEGVEVDRQGVQMGLRSANRNNFIVNGEAPPAAPFQAKEMVHVLIPTKGGTEATITLVAEIISAADDVNCKLGDVDPNAYYSRGNEPPGPVRFIASGAAVEAAQETALQEAYDDAVRQADEIAAMAGGKRGLARSIKVVRGVDPEGKGAAPVEQAVTLAVRFDLKY